MPAAARIGVQCALICLFVCVHVIELFVEGLLTNTLQKSLPLTAAL